MNDSRMTRLKRKDIVIILLAVGLVVFVPFVPSHTTYPPCHCPIGKACACPMEQTATLFASPSFFMTGIGSQIYFIQGQVVFQFLSPWSPLSRILSRTMINRRFKNYHNIFLRISSLDLYHWSNLNLFLLSFALTLLSIRRITDLQATSKSDHA